MKTIKVTLHFPAGKSTRPVTSYLIRDYNLVFNILQARIDRGLAFLKGEGIGVKEIARSIIWDGEKCTSCGACTAVCGSGALAMDEQDVLSFDPDRCVVCERCIAACPMAVLRLNR